MALRKLIDQNFEMVSGDTKDIVVTVLDESDQVVPITAASVVFTLSKNQFSAALVTKTTAAGIVISNGPGGELTITLDTADTESLIGEHYYEVELTDVSNRVSTVAVGCIDIRKNVIE
jgi:carbamoylphosphate synthase small subunit